MHCQNCEAPLDAARVEAGYDYCTAAACVERCRRPLNVVAISVNKSNDLYELRERLDIPKLEGRTRVDGGQFAGRRRAAPRPPVVFTDGQRIERLRRELDEALSRCEDPDERNRLIDRYDATVRRMNIRYRRIALYPRDGEARDAGMRERKDPKSSARRRGRRP